MKMEQTERSETSAYKLQTLGNYPKESIQYTSLVDSEQQQLLCIGFHFLLFIDICTLLEVF